jgi:CheY-like chemotaxis protein
MKPTILFVEDQPEYFGPLVDALQRSHELKQAADLTEAVECLSIDNYALLIIDIMLGKGEREFPAIEDRRSGLYLIRLIRGEVHDDRISLKCRPDIPILALTAVSDVSVHRELERLRVQVVAKPFLADALLKQIDMLLQESEDVL